MAESRDNSGILFVNDRKQKDSQPDRTGKATIAGVEYYVDAWIKDGQKGKFLSMAFKPVKASNTGSKPRQAAPPEEDIPF